jgi:hypothetical protein
MKKTVISMMLVLCSIANATPINIIPILNHSFENPVVEPVGPYSYPVVADWIEVDNDTLYGTNTGVFLNLDGITGVHGDQLAFLGGETGNALRQDLSDIYMMGNSYRLTVGACVSDPYPPLQDSVLQLALYYQSGLNQIDIASISIPVYSLSSSALEDFSVTIPTVQLSDPWLNKDIGITIRSNGPMGGYWEIDNVRLEYVPEPATLSLLAFGGLALLRKRK